MHFLTLCTKLVTAVKKASSKRHACQVLSLTAALFVSLGNGPLLASETPEGSGPDDPFSRPGLCDWQNDYAFFTGEKEEIKTDQVPCNTEGYPKAATEVASEKLEKPVLSVIVDESFTAELETMLSGYPIEVMAPVIASYDRDIAGLIVGIGKKESNCIRQRAKQDRAGN